MSENMKYAFKLKEPETCQCKEPEKYLPFPARLNCPDCGKPIAVQVKIEPFAPKYVSTDVSMENRFY